MRLSPSQGEQSPPGFRHRGQGGAPGAGGEGTLEAPPQGTTSVWWWVVAEGVLGAEWFPQTQPGNRESGIGRGSATPEAAEGLMGPQGLFCLPERSVLGFGSRKAN